MNFADMTMEQRLDAAIKHCREILDRHDQCRLDDPNYSQVFRSAELAEFALTLLRAVKEGAKPNVGWTV